MEGAKASFLEGDIRSPAIISYAAHFPEGETRDQIISFMDLLPTICKIPGREGPTKMSSLKIQAVNLKLLAER